MKTIGITPPKGERTWAGYYRDGAPLFLLTGKERGGEYFTLYEITEGSLTRLGRGRTPPELEHRFRIRARMGVAEQRGGQGE